MGTGSKVASVFLRIIELCSAAVVAGFGGEYLHYVSNAHDHPNTRLVYTVALAGISIVVSLVCMIPADVLFYGFLLDAALFIMWMVSFGLLVGVRCYPFPSFSCDSSREQKVDLLNSLLALPAAIRLGIGRLGVITGEAGMGVRLLSINPLSAQQRAGSGAQLLP